MNGNTRAKVAHFSQTIISTVQISSLGFSDTHFKVGYLQIFSMIRGLSPTRKSEKRVFYEMYRRGWCTSYHCIAPTGVFHQSSKTKESIKIFRKDALETISKQELLVAF